MTLVRTLFVSALVMVSGLTFASGGDGYDDSIYVPRHRVPYPEQAAFAGGRLGVVSGQFYRIYLVLAWRSLHGFNLSADEVDGLHISGWRVGAAADPDDGTAEWSKARALLMAPRADAAFMSVMVRTIDYAEYVNCTSDALHRAAQTLRDRLQAHGEADARLWLQGQDAVFANCARQETRSAAPFTPSMPEPLPASAPAWLKADRAYQTTAALFYSGQYREARERFLAIADDKSSPWQPLGRYLAARCLLRQATTLPTADDRSKVQPEVKPLLTRARAELLALSPSDPAASRLVGWVDARLRPAEREAELAATLQSGSLSTTERVMSLSDYLRLMDFNEGALANAQEAMTAWIGLMQTVELSQVGDPVRGTVKAPARARWQQDGDVAWLMPLVAQATRTGDLMPAEMKAMRAVPHESPAYQTFAWHLARLALASGQAADADLAIDTALADPHLAPSTRNRWLALKLVSARSVEAMLQAAPRALAEPQGGNVKPIPDEQKATSRVAIEKGIEADFAPRLYGNLPLTRLAAVAAQPAFPAGLRSKTEEVAFARALVLQDWATADRLQAAIAAPRTTTQALYRRFLAAHEPAQKKIAAALILVNTPELDPSWIQAQTGLAPVWGCHGAAGSDTADSPSSAPRISAATPVQFLSDAEHAQARAEMARLGALPIRSKWLADALLPWAATKPDDPEAPKALALLVASTRLECEGAPASTPRRQSKDAFDLLHKLWPQNEWTARTKYWF